MPNFQPLRQPFPPALALLAACFAAAPCAAAPAPGPAGRAPARRTPARRPARSLPRAKLPAGVLRFSVHPDPLRQRLLELGTALAESRAREQQTQARLAEAELLLGKTDASLSDTTSRLANLVDLYRRLEGIDREAAQLRATPAPDPAALRALDQEQDAIFKWIRAAVGDPGPPIVAAAPPSKPAGPTPTMLRAVQIGLEDVAVAEREFDRARQGVEQGLLPRMEMLRRQSELAQCRANLARAQARVRGDREAERLAISAQVEAARAALAVSEAEMSRLRTLQAAGAVAAVEVNAAAARVRRDRTALDMVQADLARLDEERPKPGTG